MAKKLRVTLVKSKYHTGRKHMATVKGLGQRRRHHTVELDDTPAVRGMINKISYMVKCEEV
jgi:large subunit ribosomal protein L30